MRKHIPHPVTRLRSPHAQLDILYGGNEADAIEESLVIARDLREVLKDGENILHINTLVSERRLDDMKGKRFDHGARRGRNYFATYCFGDLVDRLAFIRRTSEELNIKYLIMTGFELTALTSRHRTMLMAWLREMRNMDVNVIIFTLTLPGRYGALGSLRYSARSIEQVGEYLNVGYNEEEIEAAEAGALEAASPMSEAAFKAALEEVFADEAEATKLYTGTPSATHPTTQRPAVPKTLHPQHSDGLSLKTKDLAVEMV